MRNGVKLPQHRLVSLLQQAVAYQMEFSHCQPQSGKTQVPLALVSLHLWVRDNCDFLIPFWCMPSPRASAWAIETPPLRP